MRALLLLPSLLLGTLASAQSQHDPFRFGADVLVNEVGVQTAVGVSVTVLARTPGKVGAYLAVRPELAVTNEGGTGFANDRTILYYDDDGLPVTVPGVCRNQVSGEQVEPFRCGTDAYLGAISGEMGTRIAIGSGAILAGVGLRRGDGRGVYGALTGRLAAPLYARVEGGTGHAAVALGFGGF